ncbi:MAG: hypothetical protein SFV54_06865 [Bryobacteraceae bacterium]|nr:hypothetical protein [Bryobacteraceae bacterium]
MRLRLLFASLMVCAAVASAAPAIERRGVRNAASEAPPGLPGGALAPGMRVVIRGIDLEGVTRLFIEARGGRRSAPVERSEPRQAWAVLPFDVPLGQVRLAVERGPERSAWVNARVLPSSPGLFLPDKPIAVRRGEFVTLRVTGLGVRRGEVRVYVGGVAAEGAPENEGDALTFTVPAGAPTGCAVPVQVQLAGGPVSNAVAIEIEGGAACEEAEQFGRWLSTGGRSGLLLPFTLAARLEIDGTLGVSRGEGVAAAFVEGSRREGAAIPAAGTCMVYAGDIAAAAPEQQLRSLLTGSSRELDAGRVWARSGERRADLPRDDAGLHYRAAGGAMPDAHEVERPPFFDGHAVTLHGEGGRDVGAFRKTVALPDPVQWTGREALEEVDRTRPLHLRWRGATGQPVFVGGIVLDRVTRAGGGFLCLAPAAAAEFIVPPHVLSFLPQAEGKMERSAGVLLLATVPEGAAAIHQDVEGLNGLLAVGAFVDARSVRFR